MTTGHGERYESVIDIPDKWHEKEVKAARDKLRAGGDVIIKRWPWPWPWP